MLSEVEAKLAEEKRDEDERRMAEAKPKQDQPQKSGGNNATGKVTRANYIAIRNGMTEGEVVALLGQPQKTLFTDILFFP